jgi:hypothetical protein
MAQLRIKNIEKFNAQLERKIREAIKDKKLLEEIGAESLKHVKANLQLGKNAETGSKHGKVSNSYAKRKKQIIKDNSISNQFAKNPNNLSGQLAESLDYEISPNKRKLSISALGDHKPYSDKDGKPLGKTVSNADLIKWLNEKRKIFGLTEKKKKELVEIVARNLRRLLK